jgi:hypothetical protein
VSAPRLTSPNLTCCHRALILPLCPCLTAGGPTANRGFRDRGFRPKLPSRDRKGQGDVRSDRNRRTVHTERILSASHHRPARSAKHAIGPAFSISAMVPDKNTSSPDKEKEKLWEKEKGKGGNEIHSVSDRRRFWCKSVLILCTKLFISRQAARESSKQIEAGRRFGAALLIVRACRRFREMRYAAMMRILVRHRGAVKKLRLAVSPQSAVGRKKKKRLKYWVDRREGRSADESGG